MAMQTAVMLPLALPSQQIRPLPQQLGQLHLALAMAHQQQGVHPQQMQQGQRQRLGQHRQRSSRHNTMVSKWIET
jgi:hypothetical protein